MKEYTIGRAPDNDVVLTDSAISWHHAVIKVISPNTCLLEDKDSTYGTEVNDRRIAKTIITPTSKVLLSESVLLDTKPFFERKIVQPTPKLTPAESGNVVNGNEPKASSNDPVDVSKEFIKLQTVYSHYIETRRALQNKDSIKQSVLQAGCSLIPVIGRAIGTILTAHFLNDSQKLYALDEEFKINYVCPNCGRYLGEFPYQSLVNQRRCSNMSCKAIWIKD